MGGVTEEEKKALRKSKFAPLPSPTTSSPSKPRLAHPGGPLKTNKAVALAKFLERKLQEDPTGLASINPQLLQLALQNAKHTLSGGTSNSGRVVQHVNSFEDFEDPCEEEKGKNFESKTKKKKKNKNKKKNKKPKMLDFKTQDLKCLKRSQTCDVDKIQVSGTHKRH